MVAHRRKQSVGSIAASGLLLDPKIRRAALQAAPPMARLGLGIGRRAARRRAEQRWEQVVPALDAAAAFLTTYGPELLIRLGVIEPPRRSRRVAARAGAGALVGAGAVAVYLFEPTHGREHREQVQRLFSH